MTGRLSKIEAYNVWANPPYSVGLVRHKYFDRLKAFVGNKLVKVVVGQRRSGKSYLLRQIINHLVSNLGINGRNTFYLNKEYLAFNDIKNLNDLESLFQEYLSEISWPGKVYVFLDEVQLIEGWEQFVNSYSQDFTRDYEIYISGSNAELLSGELATLLSGRYVEFQIFPFSLNEFALIEEMTIGKEVFNNYLEMGGLPEMHSLSDAEMKLHYVESLKNTIILKDIIARKGAKDVALLEDIFNYIINNVGALTSVTNIVKYFKSKQRKTNYETLSTYIQFLTQTFIIHSAERYNLKGKQVLGGERKFYLNDMAFKTYLQGFFPNDIGKYLENYVYLYLSRLGYKVYVGVWDKYEIDFVAKRKNKTVYVQVAYMLVEPKTIEREFGNLLKIKDNHQKIVVSMDDMKYDNYQGIIHVQPWELDKVIN